MFQTLVQEFSDLPQVEAIALGGSRAGIHYDTSSDYDIYVYCKVPIPEEIRRNIIDKLARHVEYGNHFWELEDNGTFQNGIDFDILYRDLDSFTADVSQVAESCIARNSYTTCMWHNLLTCKILYDKYGRLEAAQRRFDIPYPAALRQNILNNGWRLLHDSLPAYAHQIVKAAMRRDSISIQHRITAFLETYFDMLFALNEQLHPGEKRLIQLCKERCTVLPDLFEENLNTLFSHMNHEPELLAGDVNSILIELAKIL